MRNTRGPFQWFAYRTQDLTSTARASTGSDLVRSPQALARPWLDGPRGQGQSWPRAHRFDSEHVRRTCAPVSGQTSAASLTYSEALAAVPVRVHRSLLASPVFPSTWSSTWPNSGMPSDIPAVRRSLATSTMATNSPRTAGGGRLGQLAGIPLGRYRGAGGLRPTCCLWALQVPGHQGEPPRPARAAGGHVERRPVGARLSAGLSLFNNRLLSFLASWRPRNVWHVRNFS